SVTPHNYVQTHLYPSILDEVEDNYVMDVSALIKQGVSASLEKRIDYVIFFGNSFSSKTIRHKVVQKTYPNSAAIYVPLEEFPQLLRSQERFIVEQSNPVHEAPKQMLVSNP
ncbi:hypothetical protein RZS08_44925, partial [Arthrospira platensis SPKY1]|nr:hypothetical protein [Arthrospira platensis SPKY1]